jgi:hypothetical protein
MTHLRVAALAGVTDEFNDTVACSEDPTSPCACRDECRTYAIALLDGAGDPLSDVTSTRTNRRTNEALEPGWPGMLEPGVCVVADDPGDHRVGYQ